VLPAVDILFSTGSGSGHEKRYLSVPVYLKQFPLWGQNHFSVNKQKYIQLKLV